MRRPSQVHLLVGQEVLYLLLTLTMLTALIAGTLAFQTKLRSQRASAKREMDVAVAVAEAKASIKPPIITLKESQGFRFANSSAEIPQDFAKNLLGVTVPQLLRLSTEYNMNLVEVVGHTDEATFYRSSYSRAGKKGGLDFNLLPFINEQTGDDGETPLLKPTDNTGLGMARAAAVVQLLKRDRRLIGLEIVPLSAGQTILPTGRLATFDANRKSSCPECRRIEIRLRRLGE